MNTVAFLAVGAFLFAGCASADEDSGAAQDEAVTHGHSACSEAYSKWAFGELAARLEKPIAEASEADTLAFARKHPPMGETDFTYGVCWSPLFTKYFLPANTRVFEARTAFFDRQSPSYRSKKDYVTNVTMTPELRRNAKVLLSLRPKTMLPADADAWTASYNLLLGMMVGPLGIPDVHTCALEPAEPEWMLDEAESEYLSVMEDAFRAAPSKDGVYATWFDSYRRWLFGPPPSPDVLESFVFNLPGEAAARSNICDQGGVRFVSGHATIPEPVEDFIARWKAMMPPALGEYDSAKWMSWYNARALRTLTNLRQNQPMATEADTLALDLLEDVKPARLLGLFNYKTWLDLMALSEGHDGSWRERFLALEPCVSADDLSAAKQAHADKASSLKESSLPVPHVCAK